MPGYICIKEFKMANGEVAFKKYHIYEGEESFEDSIEFKVNERNTLHVITNLYTDHFMSVGIFVNNLTKEQAFELSIIKWEGYVGSNKPKNLPILNLLQSSCGLCQLYRFNSITGFDCGKCPLILNGKTCTSNGHPFNNWYNIYHSGSPFQGEYAKIVLDLIELKFKEYKDENK